MTSLGHLPASARWSFDESVTRVFDDMLERSIPQYDLMRSSVLAVAESFEPGTVVDLGCSRGESIANLNFNKAIGVEVSPPMLDAARERFEADESVEILDLDLRYEYPDVTGVDVTLAVLTLQFVPIEHRQRVVRKAYESLRDGGGLIIVEKVLGASSALDEVFTRLYYDLKAANGYTGDEIERKKLSLEGVLVPATALANETMLKSEGFSHVECFWRWANFAGWVAIK